jgi:hypothetical protein
MRAPVSRPHPFSPARRLSSRRSSGDRRSRLGGLLSASITCRLQGRSLFAYLTDVLNASTRGDPIPALA